MTDEKLPHAEPGRITALVRRMILIWLVVICFDAGCSARCAGHSAEQSSRRQQIKRHVFKKTPAQIFDAAREVVVRQGYELERPAEIKDAVYTTRWRTSASQKRALTVRIDKLLTGGVKLEIHRLVEQEGQQRDRRRLYDEELEVIKKLEPVKASAIELIAQAHRRTAEKGARGCGCSETCALPGCEYCQACQTCAVTPAGSGAHQARGVRP